MYILMVFMDSVFAPKGISWDENIVIKSVYVYDIFSII